MTEPRHNDVTWSAKGPTLIAGLVALVLAMVATAKGRLILAGVLLFLGTAFLTYSLTIKEWCALRQHGWGAGQFGQSAFGGSLGECLREKTWLQF